MKIRLYLLTILFLLTSLSVWGGRFSLEDFKIELEQLTSDPSHLFVSSGYTTVKPKPVSVTGVEDFYSPPFVGKNFSLRINFKADSIYIGDNSSRGKGDCGLLYTGGVWMPHKVVRNGTYNFLKGDRLFSLYVTSELTPLMGRAGFVEKITVTNRATSSINLTLIPELNVGNPTTLSLNEWGFGVPGSSTQPAKMSGLNRWSNGETSIGVYYKNDKPTIPAGETSVSYVAAILDKGSNPLPVEVDPQLLIDQSHGAWQKRLETYTRSVPTLSSDIDGIANYYRRSIVSGLTCIWENPAFCINPFLATAGIDGGGICAYLWDNAGYVGNMATLMLGDKVLGMAEKMSDIDLEKFYAFTPGGKGVGVMYSYSQWSFTNLVSSIFKHLGANQELYEYNKKLVLNNEKRKNADNLIDYGVQNNLLEMRSTGWEHYVVSPNTERSWCLLQLGEMGKLTGESTDNIALWTQQADDVVKAVQTKLWDKEANWFVTRYPGGHKEYVHSIQVYDALRAGACTPEMEKALIAELKDGAFLTSHGVTSISKADKVHFEVLDPDWSGGGAYIGDGPQLAAIMYEKGYAHLGWDILRRHFWMGCSFAYYPQEHYCDRPMSPANKRAGEVSGLTGAETILYALFGFSPQYNGDLYIHPKLTEKGSITIKGYGFRGSVYDVTITSTRCTVWKDGKQVYNGAPRRVKIG